MYYYEVWPADQSYHKNSPLTYSSDSPLPVGTVVEMALKNKKVIGFVATKVTKKPSFSVKTIERQTGMILPKTSISLFGWLLNYYPAPSGQIASLFLPKHLPQKITDIHSKQSPPDKTHQLPPLTPAQQTAFEQLSSLTSTALLHGDTGTGKTRIYAELAKKAIDEGRSVVLLTPEIGLTPQLQQSFREVFGNKVIVNHSGLTAAKRRNIWVHLAKTDSPHIVIGPRSSLFLPIKSIGLVVLDEAHDHSYKQEQAPHYLATRVASRLAQLADCLCLLGTATPLVDDYYRLEKNGNTIVRLTEPVHKDIKKPEIQVVSRGNKENFSLSSLCSDPLIAEIKAVKQRGLTSLLFLNRRGTARQVVCQACGWIASCPQCDTPLTFHHDQHKLRCHTCDHQEPVPFDCPVCKSSDLLFKVAGTKALQQELKRLFPGFTIKKFDSDDTKDEQLHKQYEAIKDGKYDLIVGTQIIAKGLDLHNLGLVGIPYADTSLYLPDYTADEQTFQLLSQVIGRVGRTAQPTKVIVQTFQPNHPALQGAITKNWTNFYSMQKEERKNYLYPPFTYLLKLTISRKTDTGAQKAAQKFEKTLLDSWGEQTTILPATPRFYHKQRNEYHWQIIVKSEDRNQLLQIIKQIPIGWRYDIDPVSLL